MQALKDVLGRAEERSNLRSLILCTAIVVGLVTVVFGFREFRFLFDPERGGAGTEAIEESTTLQADQGGG